MICLLDTQLLLWSAYKPLQLSPATRTVLTDPARDFLFSTISLWEIAIKAVKRPDVFRIDPALLRRSLLDLNYTELLLTSEHALATARLPLLHGDPFDRMLLAQAMVEGIPLVTADRQLASYDVPLLYVG